MNRTNIAGIVVLAALCCGASIALHAQDKPTESASTTEAFFKRLNQDNSTFGQFRFLSSPEVQQNPEWKSISAQMLATDYSFLGRPNDAIRNFPIRRNVETPANLPITSLFKAEPAADWISMRAARYRAILVNEAHHDPQTRLLTLSLLPKLRAEGYAYFAVETLLNDGSDPLKAGYPTVGIGAYTREPIFADIIREAKRLGFTLVPYEPSDPGDESQQARETGMAKRIASVLAKDPEARILVHAGYGHIGKTTGGMPDGARPMAMELSRLTSQPLLSVDQTSLPRTTGQFGARLAADFAISAPSVLIEINDGKAWSYKPGFYDATVLLPVDSSSSLRPAWLSLGGSRKATLVDMTPCIDHLPCLAEARYVNEGDDAIPAAQFVLLDRGEIDTPLYLKPGHYRLRLTGHDDTTLGERELVVATVASTPSPTESSP